jgi:uncharacterized protein YqjF (DUF2071 family)
VSSHLNAIARDVAHRAWPPPAAPWAMTQGWHDLLFAHWPLPPDLLRPLVPAPFALDTYAGQAWVSVVPFRMRNVRPRGLPAVPWLSFFPELNVRTYVRVRDDGIEKPGIYFFSLEAANPIAVRLARAIFALPYYDARMAAYEVRGTVHYRSERRHRGAPPAEFEAEYGPTGGIAYPAAGTLDEWLTERYALFTIGRRGVPCIGEIHHLPWPLQPAQAVIRTNTLALAAGVALPDQPPLLHVAPRQDVLVWPLRAVKATA